MRFVLLACLLLLVRMGISNTVNDTLYINRGVFEAVDSTQFPYVCFNGSTAFSRTNKRIEIGVNDWLALVVINTDSITHGFEISGCSASVNSIPAGDTAQVLCQFPNAGVFIYHDNLNSPNNQYMGLAGMVVVDNSPASRFLWNIKEHQREWNDSIANGATVNWQDYYPDYFTINGNSNPHINTDTNARVVGSVGDTIRIYMANTGQAVHSIHFHGYHANIVYSSKFPHHVGRSKDTFPIYSMETLILEMVPHQPGEYPVHDHNLVAVSGGHIYPNGMFLTMIIQ